MSAWTRMVDTELTDEEKLDAHMPIAMPERPDYPFGLRICLTDKELEKLDLDDDCNIGDMIDIRAMAEVTSVSKSDGPNGASCRIELQITHLAVENEMTEDEADEEGD
jgi:hypothetical protein